jgi:hypothetical protein
MLEAEMLEAEMLNPFAAGAHQGKYLSSRRRQTGTQPPASGCCVLVRAGRA